MRAALKTFFRFSAAAGLSMAVSGCANLWQAECRETLDDTGVMLRFCERGDRLSVELVESRPAMPNMAPPARLIDDHKVLAALRREALGKRKPIYKSAPVALVCAPTSAGVSRVSPPRLDLSEETLKATVAQSHHQL
jgi:hypothetical protein